MEILIDTGNKSRYLEVIMAHEHHTPFIFIRSFALAGYENRNSDLGVFEVSKLARHERESTRREQVPAVNAVMVFPLFSPSSLPIVWR